MERKEEFESRYRVRNTIVFQRTEKRKWCSAVAVFKGGILSFWKTLLITYAKKKKIEER